MGPRQRLRFAIRSFLEENKKRVHRGDDHRWQQGTDDSLMLNEPGTMVEPDVRKEISKYLKKMGLMK